MTCVFRGVDISLANYAYNIMTVSRTQTRTEENFRRPSKEYEFLVSNHHTQESVCLCLGAHVVREKGHLPYLGVPIGKTLRATRTLLKDFFCE